MTELEMAQRKNAQWAMSQAAQGYGVPDEYQERDDGDRISFIGILPDGRQYGIAYPKECA